MPTKRRSIPLPLANRPPPGTTPANLNRLLAALPADVYDRIRALADDTRAAYPLAMRVFGQDGWDDPQMDEYNVLDPRR